MDKICIFIVHKPGQVLTQLGRHNIWAITLAEKGKTYTILTRVSASGYTVHNICTLKSG